jgi:MraZ protein
MLLGEYRYNVDTKGRISVPPAFRDELGEMFVLCKGIDKTLWIYSNQEWGAFVEKLSALPETEARDIKRFFFSSARSIGCDAQGRILLPQQYRDHASIDKDAVVVGNNTRAEIWCSVAWDKQLESMTDEKITAAMLKLGL